MEKLISSFLPAVKVFESRNSNVSVIDRLGDAAIRRVVRSILKGGNLRDLTEVMTRKRILLSNAALLVMYFRALCEKRSLENQLTAQVLRELALPSKNVSQEKKELLLSLIGMTRKGWDNIVRRESGKKAYVEKLDVSLNEIVQEIVEEYGAFEAEMTVGDRRCIMPTASIVRCMMALGSQTLAIRGSEKSIYGKLFERLVLGSVLSALGFQKIERDDYSNTNMVFWLSDPKNKRECDATALITPGVCVRFDIGFIGKGNPEVSLDKVTRYDHLMEIQNKTGKRTVATSHTIIIVDTIGEGSRVREMATEIGGAIIQMNGCYWVKELADTIAKICPRCFRNPLAGKPAQASLEFIDQRIALVDFSKFLPEKAAAAVRVARAQAVKIVQDVPMGEKFISYLPLYSYKVACGPFPESGVMDPDGWICVNGHGQLDKSMFVVKTEGESMFGLIPKDAYVVMRRYSGGNIEGKTLLVQRHEGSDPEDGGSYTIKKFVRKGDSVVLKAKNPVFDIVIVDDGEYSTKYRPIAEFKCVL